MTSDTPRSRSSALWRPALAVAAAAAMVLASAACGEKPAGSGGGLFQAMSPLPAAVIAASAPAGAREVADVKASAKEGDRVVVRGRVGGERDPIVPGSAVFTLADIDGLEVCDEGVCMECQTPWDACCATTARIVAGTLTVRVLGADGKPLAADVSLSKITPLAIVVVEGMVAARPDPKVLVVDAVRVFVAKP